MSKREYHLRLGKVSAVMMVSPAYQRYPMACLTAWIKPAILMNQCHFFQDLSGGLVGYATWAFLTEEVEWRWVHDPHVMLHISEWNEGDRLWIMDFVVLNGDVRRFINELKSLLPNHPCAKSLRRDDEGRVSKISQWGGAPRGVIKNKPKPGNVLCYSTV